MKVCLVAIHRNPDFIPLAPLYLKALLVERAGLSASDVNIVEFPHTARASDVAARIIELTPDLVGLSCYVWNIVAFKAVATTRSGRAARCEGRMRWCISAKRISSPHIIRRPK